MVGTSDSFEHEPLLDRPHDGRIFESSRRVRLADSSARGRLRLDACARFLQDIANDDSRDAGTPNPTAWVARRTVIRIDHWPAYLDVVALATWCSGLGSRWAERRYSLVTTDGSSPGSIGGSIQAATLWVHVDMATMRPIPVPPGFDEQFGQAAHGRTVSARQHLPSRPPTDGERHIGAWPLRFVDFDVLGHVNNSVYWAMVEEQRARRGLPDAALTVTLEHHGGIDPGASVVTTAIDTPAGFDLWVTSTVDTPSGKSAGMSAGTSTSVAAVVRATVSPTGAG